MQVDKLGFYRTLSGKKAHVVHINPTVGYVTDAYGKQTSIMWDSSGKSASAPANDILEVWTDKKTAEVDIFVFMDARGRLMTSYTRPQDTEIVGIQVLHAKVTEGDGLEGAK